MFSSSSPYPHPPYTPPAPPSLTTLNDLPALARLSPADRSLFRQFGFGEHRTIPYPIVHHAFEAHARTQPHVVAVEHKTFDVQKEITYAELDAAANRLARRLRSYGVGMRQEEEQGSSTHHRTQHRVCILGKRSIEFIIAILGVLKSGGQYVPIDGVTVTDKTLVHILHDARPRVVLAMAEYTNRAHAALDAIKSEKPRHEGDDAPPRVIHLETVIEEDAQLGHNNAAAATKLEEWTQPTDGCYVIYTSGTTGTPKGVDVRHIGASNVISGPPGNLSLRPLERIAQLLNIAFDMGAWEILAALYNGCTLCLRGNSSKEWVRLMKTVEVVISTPSVLARHDPREYAPGCGSGNGGGGGGGGRLRAVIVGGEVCPQALADSWTAAGIAFHNCCGPTEISICNTIQPHTEPGYPLSIGTPIPNTAVYILDPDWTPPPLENDNDKAKHENGSSSSPFSFSSSPTTTHLADAPLLPRAMPIGTPGIMYVGGIGVSRGYLNLPTQNLARFLPDPFRSRSRSPHVPGSDGGGDDGGASAMMMFNTGDLARWRAHDGQLDHLGRVDEQVKVKGFRVELDGVGVAMREGYRSESFVVEESCVNPQGHAQQEAHVPQETQQAQAPQALSPLPTHPPIHVSAAIALLHANELWGFLTPLGIDLASVKEGTRRVQPYYAVPTRWVVMDAFPMTRNGKVDKRQLKEVARSVVDREEAAATSGGAKSKMGVEVLLGPWCDSSGGSAANNGANSATNNASAEGMMMTTTPGTSRATTPPTPNSLPTTPMPVPFSSSSSSYYPMVSVIRRTTTVPSAGGFLDVEMEPMETQKHKQTQTFSPRPPVLLQVPPVGRHPQSQAQAQVHIQAQSQAYDVSQSSSSSSSPLPHLHSHSHSWKKTKNPPPLEEADEVQEQAAAAEEEYKDLAPNDDPRRHLPMRLQMEMEC